MPKLPQPLRALCDPALLQHTRIHLLRHQPVAGARLWIKREDETPHGSKQRKYASLLPWLSHQGITTAAVIGSEGSNNIAAAAQLLPQHGIRPVFFLREGHAAARAGNPLLIHLLTTPAQRFMVPRTDWNRVGEIATQYLGSLNGNTFLIPEGAFCEPAFAGALTLAEDILVNEEETGLHFSHIFTDAGTGLTAGALQAASSLLGADWNLEVMVRAGNESSIRENRNLIHAWLSGYGAPIETAVADFRLHMPQNARSFGAVNAGVIEFAKSFMEKEGILVDLIYNGPLMMHAFKVMEAVKMEGDILLIHGGGTASLHGFADRLWKTA